MGLENLKSVFGKIQKKNKTDLSTMTSDFQSGPTHPENDGVYNPPNLIRKDSDFNDIIPQTFDPLVNKTSDFQTGPTFNKPVPPVSTNNLTAPAYPSDSLMSANNSSFSDVDTTFQDNVLPILEQDLPILDEYEKFSFVEGGVELFKNYFYDPRTPRPRIGITKNPYSGTSKTKFNLVGDGDSGIGGFFNTDGMEGNKYSLAFRTINRPNLEEIITQGNNGQGYLAAQGFYNNYLIAQDNAGDVNNMPRYYEPGSGLNLSNSSWYAGGDNNIAPVNELTAGTFSQFNSQTRTVGLDGVAIQAAELKETEGWKSIYNRDGSDKGVGYSYPFVDRSKLKYGDGNSGFRGDEPYIRTDIGDGATFFGFDRQIGTVRASLDLERVTKFLGSNAGLLNLVNRNILLNSMAASSAPYGRGFDSGLGILGAMLGHLIPGYPGGGKFLGVRPNFPFSEIGNAESQGYLQTLDRGNQFKIARILTQDNATENIIDIVKKQDKNERISVHNVNTSMGGTGGLDKKSYKGRSDNMNMWPISNTLGGYPAELEKMEKGMPMGFKDLRTGHICVFRAYLEGLTENIAPSWQAVDYPGRSESVYSYQKTERDISFTLKLFPTTYLEEEVIYQKIRFLTGLAYPAYKAEDSNYGFKQRMQPPFLEMRIGELYGNKNGGQFGFIKSLTYTIPESSPWNIEEGRRRPKHITAAISFQALGRGVNDNQTAFYGSANWFN